jgi:hypothetical protein
MTCDTSKTCHSSLFEHDLFNEQKHILSYLNDSSNSDELSTHPHRLSLGEYKAI